METPPSPSTKPDSESSVVADNIESTVARTLETARNNSVVRDQVDCLGQDGLASGGGIERNHCQLCARDLRPINIEEYALFGFAGRDAAFGHGRLEPGGVGGHREREWSGTTSSDIDVTVPSRREIVNLDCAGTAVVTCGALVLVVTGPT